MNIDIVSIEKRLIELPVISGAGSSIYKSQAHDIAALIAYVKVLEAQLSFRSAQSA